MVEGSGGDAATVEVAPGTGRATSGMWYVDNNNNARSVPHEFGHLIGLQDEYRLRPDDYRRVTGHEPAVGDATGPAGLAPATVAANLRAALIARNVAKAWAVSVGAGVPVQVPGSAVSVWPAIAEPVTDAATVFAGAAGAAGAAATAAVTSDVDTSLPASFVPVTTTRR